MLNNLFSDLPKGFRVEEVELLNWGTFDQKIHKLIIDSENSLLTGDVGCGKSTMIDAITTLLVPPRKIKFNKAAGADDGERSALTYYNGYYTSKQDDNGKARSIGLRKGGKHISVILAKFKSEAMNQSITLAQVLWQKPNESNVTKFYVLADSELSIKEHFSNFGSQINELRKQLRKTSGLEIFDNFTKYAKEFTKLMGLGSDFKALELFNRTISMKAIGSVTQFVRENMLEKPDIESEVVKLETSYDDLKRLYTAVVVAKNKIELLQPIVDLGNKEIELREQIKEHSKSKEMLDAYVSNLKLELQEKQVKDESLKLSEIELKIENLEALIQSGDDEIKGLEREILEQGGSRLKELEKDIQNKTSEKNAKLKFSETYIRICKALGLSEELSMESFNRNIENAKDEIENCASQENQLFEDLHAQRVKVDSLENKQLAIEKEISEIKSKDTNIGYNLLKMRYQLAEAVGVDESKLPFIGELIKVKDSESQWKGAIERVMHGFALSILVPSDLYADISKYVNNTHLGQRLVYYKVDHNIQFNEFNSDNKILFNKLEIKSDSLFESWVEREVFNRFNYVCCENIEDFRRLDRAVTLTGQIKSGKGRHEKDDRHSINDKSRYVLGWDNKEKLLFLKDELRALSEEKTGQIKEQKAIQSKIESFRKQSMNLQNLAQLNFSFNDCDWKSVAIQIDKLNAEYQELSESSNVIKTLNDKLNKAKDEYIENKSSRDELLGEKGQKTNLIGSLNKMIEDEIKFLNTYSLEEKDKYFELINNQLNKDKFSDISINMSSMTHLKSRLSKHFNDIIQHRRERERKYAESRQNQITHFANQYPDSSYNVDNNLHSLDEFSRMLNKLKEEDLPRHESKFKEMFERDTIRSMAMFQSKLDSWEQENKEKIEVLNDVLKHLNYDTNPDTYIQMSIVKTNNEEVRRFKEEVRQCVENLTGNDLYSEEKFLGIERLITKMREDEKWLNEVVDVRNWSFFNAVEYYREDDVEKECYSDSGGKSGGQKEKLAYLCLASAIILQYGLVDENGATAKSKRKFNLIIIDEAFIRGSKESTRFGLELFKSLGLQLIVVTPLMKLDIISEYVSNVHYVDKINDRSRVTNMSIETYKEKSENFHGTKAISGDKN